MANHSSILARESHGQGSLVPSYSPWGCKESDTTERHTFSRDEGCYKGPGPWTLPLGTKNPRLVLSLLRVDDLWDLTQVAGGNPRAGNQREVPHRTANPGQVNPPTTGRRKIRTQQVLENSEFHCWLAFPFILLTATFGDCLIMAHYKHQVTFCKVVTTGEGYNYCNEPSPAPDFLPSNQSQMPLLKSLSSPATWSS